MAKTPAWASELLMRVAADEERGDIPSVTWRRRRVGSYSSGVTYGDNEPVRVVITAGKNRRDQKLVLLHELAHWLVGGKESHSDRFWDKAWQLFRRYGVPVRYAKVREGEYRKGAITAYHRGKREAL